MRAEIAKVKVEKLEVPVEDLQKQLQETKAAVIALEGELEILTKSEKEAKEKLEKVVEHIGQPGKGISACDESSSTIDPRFRAVGVEPTEEHRRAYRQCLFEVIHTHTP